jgi:hypothetical protein
MDYKLLVKVLSYVRSNYPVKLNAFIRHNGSGFSSLERMGFISIKKVRGDYLALLTDKGFEVLNF